MSDPATKHGAGVVMLLLAELAALKPTEFVALTVNVYAVDAVNPVIVIGEAAAVPVIFPGLDVAV
jgi:hypothetical protein